MLGKAEYVKFILKSLCEERIRIFLSDKTLQEPNAVNLLKNTDVITFLDQQGWYGQFIKDLPPDFVPLYRFAAFASDNIGKLKKDKFDVTKIESTAVKQADELKDKSKLKNFEKVFGEWHLQDLFINEVSKLKGAL